MLFVCVLLRSEFETEFKCIKATMTPLNVAVREVRWESKRQHFINKCDLFGATCVSVYHLIEMKRNIYAMKFPKKPMKCSQCYTVWCAFLMCLRWQENFGWISLSCLLHRLFLRHHHHLHHHCHCCWHYRRKFVLGTSRLCLQTTTHAYQGFIVIVCWTKLLCIQKLYVFTSVYTFVALHSHNL